MGFDCDLVRTAACYLNNASRDSVFAALPPDVQKAVIGTRPKMGSWLVISGLRGMVARGRMMDERPTLQVSNQLLDLVIWKFVSYKLVLGAR